MRILIVAATQMEVNLLAEELELKREKSHLLKEYKLGNIKVDILVTGIGTAFTAFHLGSALHDKKYSAVINVGIVGSICPELKIGDVVNVVSEEFADLGVEKQDSFLTLFEAGFMDGNEFPFENGMVKAKGLNFMPELKKVRGITTNKSAGNAQNINELKAKFHAHVESMEGAAVFYVCNWMGVNCCQIRSVSNYVEPRDSSKWNIPLALENLKLSVLELLKKMEIPVN